MKNRNKNNIQLLRSIVAIFWLGFFMAISFMEAPLKFTAPNLSMAEGLQVGKIVFGMLNYCEWAFLAAILICCFIKKPGKSEAYFIAAAGAILIMETGWLLPALNLDANRIINGQNVIGYDLHWCYVALEFVKIPVLLLLGVTGFESLIRRHDGQDQHVLSPAEAEAMI